MAKTAGLKCPLPFPGGWTLLEILVTTAVLGALAALVFPALASYQKQADLARCGQTMRQLGLAIFSWSNDHAMEWPRTSHSGFAHRQRGWMRAVLPYLGYEETLPNREFQAVQKSLFRCPTDRHKKVGGSYGMNVYFELDPQVDDYTGSPAQWRTRSSLLHPSQTILLAEVPGTSDHVMAHFWSEGGTGFDAAHARHDGKANYLMADGSLRCLSIEETFAPATKCDLWHPDPAD